MTWPEQSLTYCSPFAYVNPYSCITSSINITTTDTLCSLKHLLGMSSRALHISLPSSIPPYRQTEILFCC